jgi:hypothetical protein
MGMTSKRIVHLLMFTIIRTQTTVVKNALCVTNHGERKCVTNHGESYSYTNHRIQLKMICVSQTMENVN